LQREAEMTLIVVYPWALLWGATWEENTLEYNNKIL
jgi:hypothetical protein